MAKNFSWENFPEVFVKSVVYGKETPYSLKPKCEIDEFDFLLPYMDRIYTYPDSRFVRLYRNEIEQYFLKNTNRLVSVAKQLKKINYGGIEVTDDEDILLRLQQKRMTQTLCDVYLKELRDMGRKIESGEGSLFENPKIVDLRNAQTDYISLYPYQKKAVETMSNYFMKDDRRAGILSMPTGSGKTRTSVTFLLQEMISRGYQVVWLAHRSMLIDQAAEQFYKFAPVIKNYNTQMEEFRMICISGKHSNIRRLYKKDNVIISSVQSMCNNTMFLPNVLNEKVIIVVDEAHHALAPSYRRIIKAIRKERPEAKLLGLTATPVRMTDKATKGLMHLFDNEIIFSVTMQDLILDGTLSTPVYIPRDTNVDIETIINVDERKYIAKWGELPESLLNKVATTNERNGLIVDEYVKNKEKYGKTIVFALNGIHCVSLNDAFRERGIRSAYVYTWNDNMENQRIIERFRNNQGKDGIDVLININILTEGSDIPDIQTVFLTRPTSSDVLLMQMVGRGMRGKGCGGTEKVNIVDFCDKWTSITTWLNPKFLFESEEEYTEEERIKQTKKITLIPIDAIRDLVKGITYKSTQDTVNGEPMRTTLPIGWYNIVAADGNDTKVLVFQNQLSGYKKLKQEFQSYIEDRMATGKELILKYFNNFGMLPQEDDLESLLLHIRQEEEYPKLELLEDRDKVEPYNVAKQIKENDLTYKDTMELLQNSYTVHESLTSSIYGNFEYYKKRVIEYLLYPNGIIPVGTQVEEVEKEVYKFSAEPFEESLDVILDEIIAEYKNMFPENFERPEIQWTEKVLGGYYGVYYHDYNLILINQLLNSKSVPRNVLKFLIYHECLHFEIPGHPTEFRAKEHQFKNFQEQEYFLDDTLRDFDRVYSM